MRNNLENPKDMTEEEHMNLSITDQRKYLDDSYIRIMEIYNNYKNRMNFSQIFNLQIKIWSLRISIMKMDIKMLFSKG